MRRKPGEMLRRITQHIPLWPRGKGRWKNQTEEDMKGMEEYKVKCLMEENQDIQEIVTTISGFKRYIRIY